MHFLAATTRTPELALTTKSTQDGPVCRCREGNMRAREEGRKGERGGGAQRESKGKGEQKKKGLGVR